MKKRRYLYEDFNGLKGGRELLRYFSSDSNCRKYLRWARWRDTPKCIECGSENVYEYPDYQKYKCRKCKHQYFITSGTVLERSKIPLPEFFEAIYFCCCLNNEGTDGIAIAEHLGKPYKTAHFLHHRVMELMRVDLTKIRMRDGIYEFDELFVGANLARMTDSKKQKAGKPMVKGGVSHRTPILSILNRGKDFFGIVMPKNVDKDYTQAVLTKYIPKQAVVYCDLSKNYSGLLEKFEGGKQFNHFKDKYGGGSEHSNTVEGLNSHFRTNLRHYKSVSDGYLQRYYDEFAFHIRCSMFGFDIIERFMIAMHNAERRLSLKDLHDRKKEALALFEEYRLDRESRKRALEEEDNRKREEKAEKRRVREEEKHKKAVLKQEKKKQLEEEKLRKQKERDERKQRQASVEF